MPARPDYGPRQLADYLGAFYGQVDRARDFGLLPEPDRGGGKRWSAAAADKIHARWPEIKAAVECIGAPGLKETRGWTEAMIRDLLGEPDVLTDNPHFKSAAPRRLWLLQKVEAAEALPEFATRRDRAARQSAAGVKASATRKLWKAMGGALWLTTRATGLKTCPGGLWPGWKPGSPRSRQRGSSGRSRRCVSARNRTRILTR